MTEDGPTTLGQFLESLSPKLATDSAAPQWPPDAFALGAAFLSQTGAYLHVVREWPPEGSESEGCLDIESDQCERLLIVRRRHVSP